MKVIVVPGVPLMHPFLLRLFNLLQEGTWFGKLIVSREAFHRKMTFVYTEIMNLAIIMCLTYKIWSQGGYQSHLYSKVTNTELLGTPT